MKRQAIELLRKLSQAHGCSGAEHPVAKIFMSELGNSAYTDNLGNAMYIAEGVKKTPTVMLESHIDEVGFMVQAITHEGLIKFIPIGGWWSHTLLAQRVRILTQIDTEVIGVVTVQPPHFLKSADREKVISIDNMYIDVGADNIDEVKSDYGISVGDTIVPDSDFRKFNKKNLFLSKAFDNRVGVSLAIQATKILKKSGHPNRIITVGSIQEEVGLRGISTVLNSVQPDLAIVLEGAPADDLPSIKSEMRQCQLGKGPQIRFIDGSAILNRPFTNFAIKIAESTSIPYQVAVRNSGGTDAKIIQHSGVGVPTIVVGVPSRYIHTHNSVIDIDDYLNALKLIVEIVQNLDGKKHKLICSRQLALT